MAHQLNTDYLRRKLLNPQRQVFFPLQSSFAFAALSPPLPRKPMIHAAFILLRCQRFALRLDLLSALTCRNLQHRMNRRTCFPILTCHITRRVRCSLVAELLELVQIIWLSSFHAKPASRTKIIPNITTHNKILYLILLPSLFSPSTRLSCSTGTLSTSLLHPYTLAFLYFQHKSRSMHIQHLRALARSIFARPPEVLYLFDSFS